MRPDGDNCFNQAWQRTLRSTCALAALITALGAISAQGAPAWAPRRDLGISQERASDVQAALRNSLQSHSSNSVASRFPDSVRQEILSFYESRQFRPVWSGGAAEQQRAEEALA